MNNPRTLSEMAAKVREFINSVTRCDNFQPGTHKEWEFTFQHLSRCLFNLQFAYNSAYRKFCEARNATPDTRSAPEIPAIPAAAFKEYDLTSLPVEQRTHVFHSSGTTGQRPSRHFHSAESLLLYEASILPWFRAYVPGSCACKCRLVALTPPPDLAPHSSLVYMFATVQRRLGSNDSLFTGTVRADSAWDLDLDKTLIALRESISANQPVTLLGTAFNFVQLLDHLEENNLRLQLPPGTTVLETGGYKGRSRVLPKTELHAFITRLLGVPPSHIISEYGMSELSSQAYELKIKNSEPQTGRWVFQFPPWVQARIVSPETGQPVGVGETGLLQIFDLANVWSVMAIQTEDLAIRRADGFELLGRAAAAEPRGCSLMSA